VHGLEVDDVFKSFGGLKALSGVSLTVAPGEIVGLIGPNGSGKTTLLNVISGIYAPEQGAVRVDGVEVSGAPPHRVAAHGIARTFQNIRLFAQMSALENVQLGATVGRRRGGDEPRREAWALLKRNGLVDHAFSQAVALPYRVQRRLEITRAMAARPRYLLLDEPAAGMNDAESDVLLDEIRGISMGAEVGIVVIDHDLRLITRLCDFVVVLNGGVVIAAGTSGEVTQDQAVIDAYLGRQGARSGAPD
jgi:branched-chain amino acid transport system permease protein